MPMDRRDFMKMVAGACVVGVAPEPHKPPRCTGAIHIDDARKLADELGVELWIERA